MSGESIFCLLSSAGNNVPALMVSVASTATYTEIFSTDRVDFRPQKGIAAIRVSNSNPSTDVWMAMGDTDVVANLTNGYQLLAGLEQTFSAFSHRAVSFISTSTAAFTVNLGFGVLR